MVFGTREPDFAHVAQDNETATAEVVDHLHAVGCRSIVFIGGQRDCRSNADIEERQRGYARAMRDLGLAVPARWTVNGDWSLASGHRIAHQLCATQDRPDALIFASDRIVLGALKGLHEPKVIHQSCGQAAAMTPFMMGGGTRQRIAGDDTASDSGVSRPTAAPHIANSPLVLPMAICVAAALTACCAWTLVWRHSDITQY